MHTTEQAVPRLLRARELAEQMEEPTWRVYELAREHGMPHVRFGRAMRFDPAAVREWLRNGGTAGAGGSP